jgi:MraZ protein
VQAELLPRFAGSELHALDDKGRLIVPSRFRERLGSSFVLSIAPHDPCLVLYPTVTWTRFCERLEEAPLKDDRFRRVVRFLFAHTEEVGFDNQGRVVIPATLRAYAGIERQVVSIGLLTRIEIWAKEKYQVGLRPEDEAGMFLTDLGLY